VGLVGRREYFFFSAAHKHNVDIKIENGKHKLKKQ
jgi:hypothetical protein